MQILVITCLGFRWEIDARAIVDHRVAWVQAQAPQRSLPTIQALVDRDFLEDPDLLSDWYQGEMRWNDIPFSAKRCRRTPYLGTPEDLERVLRAKDYSMKYTVEEHA